ncbi:MAG: Ldh family oxidoreductase [Pseudolabrys sp.]
MMKAGVPVADAAKIAELMLEADLTGADAHGVFRLPQYIQRLKLGSTNAKPNIKVNRTAPATALVDGDNGMGILVVARAAKRRSNSPRKTASPGSAAICRPCGCRRCLCRAAAQARHDRHVRGGGQRQPHAARRRRGAAARHQSAGDCDPRPATSRRWCSISPTSIVSYGTIKNHKLQNQPLQPDWMIDPKTGASVTDRTRAPRRCCCRWPATKAQGWR